jgi:sterol desaturase/sphingolipid hydroxylase (fatty acid hydroxylase superfamily)
LTREELITMRSEMAQSVVRYGYVPFMVLGLNGAAVYAIANGHSYLWLPGLLAVAFATAFAAERIVPVHDAWNQGHGDDRANVWHTIVYESTSAIGVLSIPLVAWVLQITPGTLIGLWPKEWPVLAQLLLALVITDFTFTMVHYFSHRYAWLWRLHAVHHGVSRLYGFNGLVRHPLHQALDMAVGSSPMALAGMPVHVAALLGFVISVQLIVQHSNVDAALGPFRKHLSIGRIHHLHHVNWGKEGDVNFGLFSTIWDRMLGTFVAEPPRPIGPADLGIDEVPDFPRSYRAHLAFPRVYKPGSELPYPPATARNANRAMTSQAR